MSVRRPRASWARHHRWPGPPARRVIPATLLAVAATLVLGLSGCGGASSEQRSGTETAVAIRSYLAGHFVDQAWYPAVKKIETKRHDARITTTLAGDRQGATLARELCSAVLSSGRVSRALVYSSSGRSLRCSQHR